MKKKKPNIIVILTDDQGVWALGCNGNKEVHTPNLDKLANEGVVFDNFFCTSPVCSPARASLLTGKIPSQHGIHDWLRHENEYESSLEYLEGQIGYTDVLKEHGYSCGISGKWHMGNSKNIQKSFDHWYVHSEGGGPYYGAPMIKNGRMIYEKDYITDAITDDGISFIEEQNKKNNPFYLSVNYTAPHSPWINQHPKKFVELYDDCNFDSCPKNEEHPWSTTNYRENHEENLKGYYAAITAMDENVGRILNKLESLNIKNDTLVWFLSDNGFNFGHHGVWGKGNGTFPQNMYDTSIKVPAIVSHPRHIKNNQRSDTMVSGYDFMPTLLDYLDLEVPNKEELPGKSIAEELKGNYKSQTKDDDENIIIFDEYGPVRMIRNKSWKYIHRYPYGPHELYDLINDPDEKNNLVNKEDYYNQLINMRNQLDNWFVKYVSPDVDGIREAVVGAGQGDLAGVKSKRYKTYYSWNE